jgi:hypothetical protein
VSACRARSARLTCLSVYKNRQGGKMSACPEGVSKAAAHRGLRRSAAADPDRPGPHLTVMTRPADDPAAPCETTLCCTGMCKVLARGGATRADLAAAPEVLVVLSRHMPPRVAWDIQVLDVSGPTCQGACRWRTCALSEGGRT